ncbi:MAM and LDL-receptor class A domain-containing protein 1-like isoform X1 [Mercenaria mercenaria]|uniref:MAM and LDL-receptor class A domain-containing protein 1-like isoform X1 n=1 Tax=Mercenaria mercenaria TaxID=6596 RepID=UPI00234F7869|nr:MAM and LDL-receptor class A domain-containing protein 1-like isoform X1 [Mercenaria mercenaria]
MLKEILCRVKCVTLLMFICHGFQDWASLDCNFEDGLCNWQQDISEDFDWLRESGHTRSRYTGPNSDHTTGDDGHYIYIEASNKIKDETAVIISPVQHSGPFCLTFWYNMYGKDIGALNVYMILSGGNITLLLTKDENHGNNDWRKAVINNNAKDTYRIAFEGVRGDGSKGDIAVDDISIIPTLCSLDCDYDDGFCNWMQYDGDNFDWTLQRGPTETSDTGPEADHTSGNGQYAYIDSSQGTKGGVAWLMSPLQNAGKYCFSFWYYMYGEDVDRLAVGQWYRNGTAQVVFRRKGNQGRKWF